MPWQFSIKIQRVQLIILIAQIQQADLDLGVSPKETVSSIKIQLPEIVAWQRGSIAVIALQIPVALSASEETGGMIEQGKQGKLVERRGISGVAGAGNGPGNFGITQIEFRLAQLIARTDGPVVT